MKPNSISVKYVTCPVCGKKTPYKTKKPKTCKFCANAKEATKFGGASKLETRVFYVISDIIKPKEFIINGYYSWLISPKGAPMQLDFYCPEYGFAIEVQGEQHETYNRYFHKSKKNFEYSKRRDQLKRRICNQKGITLIYIPFDFVASKNSLFELINTYDPPLARRLKQTGDSK